MTKLDICPQNVFKENLIELKQFLKDKNRIPFLLTDKTPED